MFLDVTATSLYNTKYIYFHLFRVQNSVIDAAFLTDNLPSGKRINNDLKPTLLGFCLNERR